MTVEIIRHGETALQADKRYQGRTDEPLSPEGIAMLQQSGRDVPRVYVSPLLRSRQTAAILFPAAEQIVIDAFAEMDFGAFEGRSYREMEGDAEYRAWVEGGCTGRCPGGESKAEFCDRVCEAFEKLMDSTSGSQELVIVAHGGTMMAVLERFGRPAGEYFAWQRPSGAGWLLGADGWGSDRTLRVLAETDCRRDGGSVWK